MKKSTYKRSLAAVVFTDIVGYSSIMQKDESRAKVLRNRHREIFDKLTPEYNGKILQYFGDGTLSVFDSAVDAVECATKMQLAFQQEPHVPLKIGIHLGDIAFDDQEAFGDGMNIASRIERICSPRSIFMSYKVHDEIKNHEWLKTKHLGSFNLKNIKNEIDIYAVTNEGIYAPEQDYLTSLNFSQNKAARSRNPLPKWILATAAIFAFVILGIGGNYAYHLINPHELAQLDNSNNSIAVLPFTNFGDNEENEYFSDGITEDILTLLSQIEGLDVVSRTSVMQYKNTEKDINTIARELGANHILEGSVRKSGNKVRIVAQLIDAKKDSHIWANTYDKEMTEIFEVQSEVAQSIATALKSKLSDNDIISLSNRPTENVMAYDFYLKGRDHYRKYTMEENDKAISLFKNALDMDASFALAYAGLGDALAQKAFKKGVDGTLIDSSINMSKMAIQLKPGLSEGHKALGLAYQYLGDYDKALDAYLTAMKYDSKNDMAATNISSIYTMEGDYVKSFDWANKALEINPSYHLSLLSLAYKYFSLNMDDEVTATCKKGIALHPDFKGFYTLLGTMNVRNQDYNSAHLYADEALLLDPENLQSIMIHANAYFFNKKYTEAREAYEKVLSVPKNKMGENFIMTSLANGTLGYMDIQEGKIDRGAERINKVIEEIEKMPETFKKEMYYNKMMGYLYAALGNNEKALMFMKNISENDLLDVKFMEANHLFNQLLKTPDAQEIIGSTIKKQDAVRLQIRKLGNSVAI